MSKPNQSVVAEYFQAKANLEQIASEEYSDLKELDSKLSREKYPTCDEANLILYSLKELSLAFASYVEKLKELAQFPETIAEWKRNSDAEIIATQQCLHTLSYPRRLALDVSNSIGRKIPATKHWQRVYDLLAAFAYLGSTYSASTSLISRIWGAKQLFDDNKIDRLFEENCKLITDYVHEEDIRGLKYISRRATFLSETRDDKLEAGDIDWWCDQVDSEFYEHKLESLLENCPSPSDEKVKARLDQLVKTRIGLSHKILERIGLFLQNGG